MNKLPPSPILQFNPNQIEEVRKIFNYDVQKIEQDLNNFEEWIEKQNHFVVRRFDRDYLERVLIASKGSIEVAKKRLDKLCTLRTLMPDYLRNFDVRNEFAPLMKWCYTSIFPKPTSDNYRILATIIFDPEEPVEIDFVNFYRFYISLLEYMFNHDYNAGYELIFDTRMFSLVSKLNLLVMRKAATVLLEAIGLRLKHLHVISGSKMFDIVLSVIKQALSEKLVQRIVIHDSPESIQKYISPEILPVDYGGKEKSMKELCEATLKEMGTDEHVERLKLMEQAATDESHRVTLKFNEEYLGMPGSFKTLNVD